MLFNNRGFSGQSQMIDRDIPAISGVTCVGSP